MENIQLSSLHSYLVFYQLCQWLNQEPGFPYTFAKKYEAIENFDLFKNKQEILEHKEFPISKYFKYPVKSRYEYWSSSCFS